MTYVIIESPYAGDVKKNLEYAKKCLKDSIDRGEYPIASHLLYTQVLDDKNDYERRLGIGIGLAWLKFADKQVFYVDYGMSKGMNFAMRAGNENHIEQEFRKILNVEDTSS